CSSRVTADGLRADQNYRFRQRGIFRVDYAPTQTQYSFKGEWSDWVMFISAGVPNWGVFIPTIKQPGFRTLQMQWESPSGDGSPVTGYFLDYVEQRQDPTTGLFTQSASYQMVYNGTGEPTVLQAIINIELKQGSSYKFRLYAINRVGYSIPVGKTYTVQRSESTDLSLVNFWSAGIQDTIRIQAVHPVTRQNESDSGDIYCPPEHRPPRCRIYLLSIVEECELNPSKTLCIPKHVLATYNTTWDNAFFQGLPMKSEQAIINEDWGGSAIVGFSSDYVSARWVGYLRANYTENYTILLNVDNGARLWIGEKRLIDYRLIFWATVKLEAMKFTPIVVEYLEKVGNAKIQMSWSSPNQFTQIIPKTALFKSSYIQNTPIPVKVSVGDTSEELIDPVTGLPTATAVAYGEALVNTDASVLSTIFVQAQDSMGNHADHNRDVFVLEISGLNNSRTEQEIEYYQTWSGQTIKLYPSMVADPANRTVIGLHRIDFVVEKAGTYDVSIFSVTAGKPVHLAGFPRPQSMIVHPGPASSASTAVGCWSDSRLCLSLPVNTTYSFRAGVESTFLLELRDAYGNLITPDTFDPRRISISVEWRQYDACSFKFEDFENDCGELNMKRGNDMSVIDSTFPGFQTIKGNVVVIRFTALRAGHSYLRINLDDKPIDQSPIAMKGIWNDQPSEYTIIQANYPVSEFSLTFTFPIQFEVLLRDRFSNPIEQDVGANSGILLDFNGDGNLDRGRGVYVCRTTPTIAGVGLHLYVMVGGRDLTAMYVDENAPMALPQLVPGPFALTVTPGNVKAEKCTIVGDILDTTVMDRVVGQNFTLLLQLRDENSNPLLTNRETTTKMRAYFVNPLTGITEPDVLFNKIGLENYMNGNGTYSINVRSEVAGYLDLYVKVGDGCATPNGIPCDFLDQVPIRQVFFRAELANPTGTICNPVVEVNAGDLSEFSCFPRDKYKNPVLNTKLSMRASFMKREVAMSENRNVGMFYFFDGTFDWRQQSYNFPFTLQTEGEYSIMVSVRSPGGLVGYYYRDLGFNTLVKLETQPNHTESTYFSVVDRNLDFEWSGVPESCPELAAADFFAVYWEGFIVPDRTGTYQFKLSADGGLRWKLFGEEVLNTLPSFGERIMPTEFLTQSYQLAGEQLVPLEVYYVHGSGPAFIKLEWMGDATLQMPIPTHNLRFPLNVGTYNPPRTRIKALSASTPTDVEDRASLEQNGLRAVTSNKIRIQLRDKFGNALS
ncbi:unnamed protein product, partial [Amoebophrya sp. A120]